MLIFHHLFLGLMIGAILAVLFSNKWAILYCGIGEVLPDLLDKPLSQIMLLIGMHNPGRAYTHTLLFAAILIMVGMIVLYKNRQKILLFCIGIGVFFHQLGDSMWNAPVSWFWPFYGTLPPFDDIYTLILDGDLSSLYLDLWILAAITGAAVIFILYFDLSKSRRGGALIKWSLIVIGAILLARYIIWNMLLNGAMSDFFQILYLRELLSVSEWIYAIISLILILLLLDYPVHFSKKTKKLIIRTCGVGAVIMSLLLLIGFGLGLPIDLDYNRIFLKFLACAGLFVGGIILLSLEKRLLHLI